MNTPSMNKNGRPIVGVTLDSEAAGGYSKFPWYALRQNYAEAIIAAGGLPMALPHEPALADAYLDRIDALVVTGGAFDVDPALYGDGAQHETVTLKAGRTATEMALTQGAMARGLPVLGICGGAARRGPGRCGGVGRRRNGAGARRQPGRGTPRRRRPRRAAGLA
jgi:putative glutamine amidotransferase